MSDYILLAYETLGSEKPLRIYYRGDLNGAIDYAKEERAFEVDILRRESDIVAVCCVMDGSRVIYV